MQINKRLNLVVPVERNDGTVYVHSTPFSREVFERNFLVLSKTFAAIYGEGLGALAGPRVARLMLRRVAEELDPGGTRGVGNDVLIEIRRLSSVILPTDQGWVTILLQEAVDKNYFSADDMAEVENVLTFFIVNSSMQPKSHLADTLDGMVKIWDAQITPLNSTEFCASLKTSTETDNIGGKETPSSIPF